MNRCLTVTARLAASLAPAAILDRIAVTVGPAVILVSKLLITVQTGQPEHHFSPGQAF